MPETSWRARPALAASIEALAVLVPVVGASALTWRVGLALPRMSLVVTLLVLAPVAVVSGVLMDRLARRIAPLSVLLRMAMVFPDRTPSRFAVAREAGHPRELTRRLLSDDLDESAAASSVLSLVGALSAHDRRTRGHSERVRAYTDLLSERMGLAEPDRDRLRWSGLLHDIGKLDVPQAILNKPGRPDAAEWQTLQQHPDHGARLAAPLLPWLGEWGDAIAHHHERYDGTGYPRQLSGEEISLGGRIVSVVDSFETMTASRSYKKAVSHRVARAELARCAGSQFDPVVVREFLQISLPRLLWAMGPVAALLQLPFLTSLRYAGGQAVSAGGGAATALATPAIAAGVATAFVSPALAAAPVHHHGDHVHLVAAVQESAHRTAETRAHPEAESDVAKAVTPAAVVRRHHPHVVHHHHDAHPAAATRKHHPAPSSKPAAAHFAAVEHSTATPKKAKQPATEPDRHRTRRHAGRPVKHKPARPAEHKDAPPVKHQPEPVHHQKWWHRSGHHHFGFPFFGPQHRHDRGGHGNHHHHGHEGH